MSKNDKIDELYIKLGQYIQIVDRLKKRIEELKTTEKNYTHPDGTVCKSAVTELEKILEGYDVDCPMHHLPAIPDKNMVYQCKKCVEETRERNNELH